jgi:hypothetical protein
MFILTMTLIVIENREIFSVQGFSLFFLKLAMGFDSDFAYEINLFPQEFLRTIKMGKFII